MPRLSAHCARVACFCCVHVQCQSCFFHDPPNFAANLGTQTSDNKCCCLLTFLFSGRHALSVTLTLTLHAGMVRDLNVH